MRILLATTNPHKLREIRALLNAVELIGLDAVRRSIPEAVEDGDSFEANAMKKAQHYAGAGGTICLADDSGLEVDALGGEPGVRSARYAGIDGPRSQADPANNRLLLDRLGDRRPGQRSARFVCAMALAAPDASKPLVLVRGIVEGRILMPEEAADPAAPELGRGTNGFGYDPLFLVPRFGKTAAELSPEQKNRISHRGHAAREMDRHLQRLQERLT